MSNEAQVLAEQLLAYHDSSDQPDFSRNLADLSLDQALATVATLKQRVDDEKLRNAYRALQIAEIAQAVAAAHPASEVEALALWASGNALCHLSRHQEALTCYHRAEALYRAQAHTFEVVRLQINQVAVLQDISDFAAALELATQARDMCAVLGAGADPYLALLEMNVGAAYQQMGASEAALMAYERGRAILEALGDAVQVARMDLNRAIVLQEMGRFQAATDLFLTARATLATSKLDQEVARANHNLGHLAYRRGQYQAALRFLEEARRGFAAIPNPLEVAMVSLYRSFVYRDLNLLPETIMLAAEAERQFRQANTQWMRAAALTNQGLGYQRLGAYAQARRCLDRARRVHRQQGAHMRVVLLDVERATLALEEGRVATAQRLVRRVARQLAPDIWPALVVRVHLLLARCAMAQAHPRLPEARQYAANACDLAARYHLPEQAAAAHMLGHILEDMGEAQAAWMQYQVALAVIEELRAALVLDEFQLGFMDDKLVLYDAAVRLAQQIATPAQVLALLNLASTAPVSHLAWLSPLPASLTADDTDLRARLQSLRETWHWYQSELEARADPYAAAPPGDVAAPAADLQQRLRSLESEMADITRRWHIQAHPVAQPVTSVPVPAPLAAPLWTAEAATAFAHDLQRHLAPDAVLLHYFVCDGQFGAMLVTHNTLHLLPQLAAAASLQRVLRSWRFHLEHGHASMPAATSLKSSRAHLERLYTTLIAPLERYLAHQQHLFLVVPPGWHDIPFAALFDGQHYLVERWQLTYLSAPEALVAHTPAFTLAVPEPEAQALVIGYSEQGRLPHTQAEAQQINRTLAPVARATCVLEDAATLDYVRAAIPGCHILHMATHALFRPDNPLFSWMRLADGRLTVADLYELTLPQRPLVVLSACETGRGQPRGGGLLGMGRGFLAAGAAGLVVSLWKIADDAAAQVMTDFYAHLVAVPTTLAPADALAQAQRLAIARSAHPSGWAGFIFIRG